MSRQQHCSREQIHLFLAQQLSREEQDAVEVHLEGCSECRGTIDTIAAPKEFWKEAVQSLTEPRHPHAPCHIPSQRSGQSENTTLASGDFTLTECPHDAVSEYLRQILLPPLNSGSLGQLAQYDVTGIVGQGGMSIVLRAVDLPLNRTVAIKILSPILAASDSARLRFSREARAAAAVVHPCVTPVFSVSEWRGLPFLVMPYVHGETLQKYLNHHHQIPLKAILTIGIQIADGLEAAHRSNIIHRDIKPANILLEGGILGIRITDFGLARTMGESNLTQSGIVAGTPSYMSPEQARGIPLDHRSDLFSFGSVLYALATGQPPFSAETPLGVLRKITEEEPRTVQEIRADLPDWFSALIHRLLRKNAEDRYSTAGEVSALLNQCLQHILPGNNVPVPRELLSEYRVCSARRIIVFGTAAVAVLVVVAMLIRQRQPAPVIPSQTAEETRDTATASERTVPRKYPVQSLEVNGLNKPEVKYAFPENQTVSYLFECSGRKELLKEQINGLITLVRSVGQSDESSIPLQVRCRIERNRSEQTSGSTPSGPAFTSTSSLSLTSSDDRILSLLITSEGAVLRRDRESQLPLGLGDAVKLVIHDFSSASIGSHQNKRVVMHDSSSNQYPSPTGPGQAGILSTHPGADLPPQSGLSPPFARFHDQRAFVIPVFQFEQSSVQNSLELAVTTQQQPSNDSRIRIREQFLSPQTGNVRIAGTAVRTFDEESGVLDFTEIHQTILEGIDENGKPDSQWKVDLDCRRITEQESEEWEQKRRLPDDVPASDVEKENPFRIAE